MLIAKSFKVTLKVPQVSYFVCFLIIFRKERFKLKKNQTLKKNQRRKNQKRKKKKLLQQQQRKRSLKEKWKKNHQKIPKGKFCEFFKSFCSDTEAHKEKSILIGARLSPILLFNYYLKTATTPSYKQAKKYFAKFGVEKYIKSNEMFSVYVTSPWIVFQSPDEEKEKIFKVCVYYFF